MFDSPPRQTTGKISAGKLVVLGMFAVILAIWFGAFRLISANGADPAKEPGRRSARPSDAAEFRGIALQLHNGVDKWPYERWIDQIAAAGANTISLVVTGYQENASSASIFIDLRKTPSDRRLKQLIAHARKRNLRVVLMPIVLLENARENEWRGKINPDSWDDWWEDYTNFVVRYAVIASLSKCEVFVVGSELISTETQTKRWRQLIRRVRDVYGYRLCYSANWDHYRPIEWWDDLDIAGMTTYYDLTGGQRPTVERLVAAWKPIKADILAWQKKIDRPIMFTEVGWPNQKTCAQYPWNYYSSDEPDPVAQANCFEAFFRTWFGEPAVAGFLVWEWQSRPDQQIGPEDIGYVPAGKPALDVIRKYYAMPAKLLLPTTSPSAPADPKKQSGPAALNGP